MKKKYWKKRARLAEDQLRQIQELLVCWVSADKKLRLIARVQQRRK